MDPYRSVELQLRQALSLPDRADAVGMWMASDASQMGTSWCAKKSCWGSEHNEDASGSWKKVLGRECGWSVESTNREKRSVRRVVCAAAQVQCSGVCRFQGCPCTLRAPGLCRSSGAVLSPRGPTSAPLRKGEKLTPLLRLRISIVYTEEICGLTDVAILFK